MVPPLTQGSQSREGWWLPAHKRPLSTSRQTDEKNTTVYFQKLKIGQGRSHDVILNELRLTTAPAHWALWMWMWPCPTPTIFSCLAPSKYNVFPIIKSSVLTIFNLLLLWSTWGPRCPVLWRRDPYGPWWREACWWRREPGWKCARLSSSSVGHELVNHTRTINPTNRNTAATQTPNHFINSDNWTG